MCFAEPVADCLAELMVLVLSDSFVIPAVLCHTGSLVAGFLDADFLAVDLAIWYMLVMIVQCA